MRKLFISKVCGRIGNKTFLCVAEQVDVPPAVDFETTVSDEIQALLSPPPGEPTQKSKDSA